MLPLSAFDSVHVQAAGPYFIEDDTLQFQIGLHKMKLLFYYFSPFLTYVVIFELDRHRLGEVSVGSLDDEVGVVVGDDKLRRVEVLG